MLIFDKQDVITIGNRCHNYMEQEHEARKNKSEFVKPIVVFEPERQNEYLPVGAPGEERDGIRFFRVEKIGEKKFEWRPITVELGGHAILRAVNKEQYEAWQGAKIIAQPIRLIFNDETKIWAVEETSKKLPEINQETGEPEGL